MPAPIVFRPQYGPYDSLLANMLFSKIQHNYAMKEKELDIKARQAEVKERRGYEEGQTKQKQKFELTKEGNTPVTPSNITPQEMQQGQLGGEIFQYDGQTWRRKAEKQDSLKGGFITIGDKQHPYSFNKEGKPVVDTQTGYPKEADTGDIKNYEKAASQGYKGSFNRWLTDIKKAGAPQISIGEKQKQQDQAFLNSPKFISDVSKDVKQLNAFDWDLWDSNQKDNAVKMEADKRVRITYPNAQYGKKNGKEGWYIKQGNDYELVVPWSK